MLLEATKHRATRSSDALSNRASLSAAERRRSGGRMVYYSNLIINISRNPYGGILLISKYDTSTHVRESR